MRHQRQIHLITDPKQTRGNIASVVAAALRGGVDLVQLREKSGPALRLYEGAVGIIPKARKLGARVSINDRVDVALATGADGVHLAARSLPPEAARALIPPEMLLGVSVHGLEEARAAVDAGADYVTFGHVYPTSSKPGLPPRGVRGLSEIVESVGVPVLAIGGIDASNVREVLATGAAGIAVISTILAAEDPESAARELRRAVDDSPGHPRHPFPERTKGGKI
ncbi:MAG: thiamine phosphate synthase [Rubrobacteraceae bacterium]